jgi:Acyl-CoA synthetases (AMP-forming)/AMP-acid ligases II
VSYDEDSVTWRELDARSNGRAAQLLKTGVARDDMVAIALANGTAHHEWTFGAWKAGATPCVLPYRLPAHELSAIVELAAPRVIVGSPGLPWTDGSSKMPSHGGVIPRRSGSVSDAG